MSSKPLLRTEAIEIKDLCAEALKQDPFGHFPLAFDRDRLL